MHGEKHADGFGQVLFAFIGQVLLLGLFQSAVLALEGGPAAYGDDEGGVQSYGVVLEAVHGGFARVLCAELEDELFSYAFYVGAVGEDLIVGGGGCCVGVEALRDDLAEVVHGFEVGPSFCFGGR